MGKLERGTVEFYTAIAGYKGDDLDGYINAILEHGDAIDNSTLENIDNSEVQYKSELYDKPVCPVDPFERVMCENCQ